jgi:PAS domain S-box-containing protein
MYAFSFSLSTFNLIMTADILKIHVVEDDAIISMNIREMLKSFGYKVTGYSYTGEAALRDIPEENPDIVLMDIKLQEELSGIDVARELSRNYDIPVVFLTAYSNKDIIEKVKEITPYGYILKPVTADRLNTMIEIIYNKYISDVKLKQSEQRYHGIVENLPLYIFRYNPYTYKITYVNNNFCQLTDLSEDELLRSTFFNVISPEIADSLKNSENVKSSENKAVTYEFKITSPEGEDRWYNWINQAIVNDKGETIEFQTIGQDITERKLSEIEIEQKTEALNNRFKELNCLYAMAGIAEEFSSDIESMMKEVIKIIPQAMHNPDKTSIEIEYCDKILRSRGFKRGKHCYLGYIHDRERDLGTLSVYTDEGDRGFTDEEINLLDAVTERINRIVEQNESQMQLRRLEREIINISESERQSIGHDLHDGLGQLLTGISFMIKSVESKIKTSGTGEIKEMTEVRDLVKEATVHCRQLSRGLSPITIESDSLNRALDQLASSTREVFNISCELSISKGINISDAFVTTQLYRIAQEAVNNCVKHSCAASIMISLVNDEDGIHLIIKDDGVGFNDDYRGKGLGLHIMGYRADLINGHYTIKSDEGKGTLVQIDLPLETQR